MTDPQTSQLDCVVHLGAGVSAGLPDGVSLPASRYVLVEGDVSEALELKRHLAHRQNAEVIDCFVAGESGPAVFHQCSFRELSSLAAPSGLERRFPGVRVEQELDVEATGIAELLSQLEIDEDSALGIVIDTPGIEMDLVRALQDSGWLKRLREIVLLCDLEGVYEGSAGADSVLEQLQSGMFAVVQEFRAHDPDRPCWRLTYDERQQELEALRSACRQLEDEREALRVKAHDLTGKSNALEETNRAISAQVEELKNENESLRQERNRLSSRCESLSTENRELEHKLKEARLQIKQKDAERTTLEEISEMRRLLQNQTAHFRSLEHRVSDSLMKGIADSTRTFHALSRLGRILGDDFVSPQMLTHLPGTEFALSLVEEVRTGKYDLIIQFGADTLIPMLARAMHNHLEHIEYSGEAQEGSGERGRKELTRSGNRRFLPTPLLGFECSRERWEEVLGRLEDHQVAELAEVDYAPLVEDRDREDEPCLFFSCRRALEGIASTVASPGRRLLVVIDLDRAMPEGFSWYPALVHVLNALSSCDITLFVTGGDDAARERRAAEWRSLLDSRSLPWEEAPLPGPGNAWRIRVNGLRRG
jgi:hypothetical protein